MTPKGYSLGGYGRMLTDRVRTAAYVDALTGSVRPGMVVLEIGAGPGFFSLIACELGAGTVIAVEPHPVVALGPQIAAENGRGDQIRFIQDISTNISLAEPADVIVSDLRGVLPLFEQHIPSIVDARERLLAPHGRLIPASDIIRVAPVSAPDAYQRIVAPWSDDPHGIQWQAARRMAVNQWIKAPMASDQLIGEPQTFVELDYTAVSSPNAAANLHWTFDQPVTGHGLCLWFDSRLTESASFSNAPGQPELIYGQAFFPWEQPISFVPGSRLNVSLRATLVGGDYVWQWATRSAGPRPDAGTTAVFQQSTFYGSLLSRPDLRQLAADFVPAPSRAAQVDQLILSQFNGRASLDQIARAVIERFPGHFPDAQRALDHVSQLASTYQDNTGRDMTLQANATRRS